MTAPTPDLEPAPPRVTGQVGTAEETVALGRRLAELVRAGDLLVLAGELGAGKTTLVRGLADGLGVRGPITSPTFVIARVHPSLVGGPDLLHADAYRLTGRLELEDLGLEVSLAEAVTVVEWGVGLAETLAESYLTIRLARTIGEAGVRDGDADGGDDGADDGAGGPRSYVVTGHGPRWSDEPDRWRQRLA